MIIRAANREKEIEKMKGQLLRSEEEQKHRGNIAQSLEKCQNDIRARNAEMSIKVDEMELIQGKLNRRNQELEQELSKMKENQKIIEIESSKVKKTNEDKNLELSKTIKDLEKSCSKSQEKLAESSRQNQLLEKELKKVKREQELLIQQGKKVKEENGQEQNTKLPGEKEGRNSESSINVQEIQRKEQQISDLQALNDEKGKELIELNDRITQLQDVIRDLEGRSRFESEEKQGIQKKYEELLKEKQQEIDELIGQLEEAKKKKAKKSKSQVNQEQERGFVESSSSNINENSRNNKDKESTGGDAEKELALTREMKEVKGMLLNAEQELGDTKQQIQMLSSKYEKSKQQMQAQRLQFEESLGKLTTDKNGEIKVVRGNLEAAQNELKNSKEKQNLLNIEVQETQEKLKVLSSRLHDSEEKLKKQIYSVQECERNLQETKSLLLESQNRQKQTESELKNIKGREERLREQLKGKDEEIGKLRGVIEEHQKEKQSKLQLDSQKATEEESQQNKLIQKENEQLSMLQALNDSLKSSLASTENNLEDAKSQIENLTHTLEGQQNANRELSSRIVELAGEVKLITDENLQLNHKITDITGKNEQSQNLLKQTQKDNAQLLMNLEKLKDQTAKQINDLTIKNQENQSAYEEKLKAKETTFKKEQENQETQWNEKLKKVVQELKDAQESECQAIRQQAEVEKSQQEQKSQELQRIQEKLHAENGQLEKEIAVLNEKIKQLGKELLDKGLGQQGKEVESGIANAAIVPRISSRRAEYAKKEGKSCGSHSSRYSGASSERFRIQQQLQPKEQQQQQQVSQLPALGGMGLKLNLENVVVGGGEEDRMHIRRDRGKGENEIHEGQQIDERPNGSSASDEEEFKQGVIEIQSKKMEEQAQEINDLKHQIDLMFEDLADKDGYIQHLEQLLDQKELETQQIKLEQEQQQQNNLQQPMQQQQPPQQQLETKKVPTPVGSPKEGDLLKSQLSTATLQLKQLKIQVSELVSANDELETRIEEKENKILELQENQHGESAEEQIGVLTEQLDKALQKVRRHEEDLVYQQQVVQQQRQRIEELEGKLGINKRDSKDQENENNDEDDNDSNEGDLVKHLGLNKEKPLQQGSQPLQQLPQQVQKNFSSNDDIGKSGTEGDALSSGRSPNNSGAIGGMRNRNELRYDQIQKQQQVIQQQQQQNNNKQIPAGQQVQSANSAKQQEGKRNSRQIVNTAEAEQLEEMLIAQKINLQQQIAELKSEFELIPEEDHIRIQELEQQLEHNKKEFAKLYEQASSKQVMANMNDKYLSMEQMYKELKEDRENIKQNLDTMMQSNNQIVSVISSAIPDYQRKQRYDDNNTQLEPVSMVNKLSELYKQALLNIQQLQQQLSNQELNSSRTKNDHHHNNSSNNQDNNTNSGFMQILSNLLDTVLINKKAIDDDFEEETRKTLPQNLADKITEYISSVIELLHGQMSLKMEAEQLQQKVQELSESLEKQKNTNKNNANSKNDEFQVIIQKAPLVMSQEPFDPQDLENLRREQQNSNKKINNNNDNFKNKDDIFMKDYQHNNNNNLVNDENNESSFLSMSEQIIKELDGNSSKHIQVAAASANHLQANAIIKQLEEQINVLRKENEEIKASNDYLTSRQDELFDEIKAKDDIIQTTELALKSLKKEFKKQKENTDAVEQKEHLKKIFLQFLYAISDKKKQMEAEEFIHIIFSMLGIVDKEKEQLIEHLAPKQADRKKPIALLLLRK